MVNKKRIQNPRLQTEPQSTMIGIIPTGSQLDDANDEGGISGGAIIYYKQVADPISHTFVEQDYTLTRLYRHLQNPMVEPL